MSISSMPVSRRGSIPHEIIRCRVGNKFDFPDKSPLDSGLQMLYLTGYTTGMLDKKLRSFRYAFRGFRIAWREEFNFRFDVMCALLAVALGWYFGISSVEWLIVIFLIGFVLAAETFNTALEELCDMYRPVHDPHVAKIKDLSAGAVLLAATASLIIGCIIFLPRIAALFV